MFSSLFLDFVRKCSTLEDYRQALVDSMKFENMDLLIEEFYDGHELDIDILVQNNKPVFIGISDNFKPSKGFYETGNMCPSGQLDQGERLAIESIVSDWIPKYNIKHGLLHFEAFCRPKGLYPNRNYDVENPLNNIAEFFMPIELNLRLGGGETWSMNFAAYGVDLFRSYVDIMLGYQLDAEELEIKQHNPRHCCISHIFFPDKNPCEIQRIELDMEAIEQCENIVEVALPCPVGFNYQGDGDLGWMTIVEETGSAYNKLVESRSRCAQLISHTCNS